MVYFGGERPERLYQLSLLQHCRLPSGFFCTTHRRAVHDAGPSAADCLGPGPNPASDPGVTVIGQASSGRGARLSAIVNLLAMARARFGAAVLVWEHGHRKVARSLAKGQASPASCARLPSCSGENGLQGYKRGAWASSGQGWPGHAFLQCFARLWRGRNAARGRQTSQTSMEACCRQLAGGASTEYLPARWRTMVQARPKGADRLCQRRLLLINAPGTGNSLRQAQVGCMRTTRCRPCPGCSSWCWADPASFLFDRARPYRPNRRRAI